MYKHNDIRIVHLELSSSCQAKCPMCARNHYSGLPNPKLTEKNLSLLDIKNFLPILFLQQIDKITLCGNFGDAIVNNDLLEIIDYLVQSNKNIILEIHTNASARNVDWWTTLAKTLPKNHVVIFGIDGLKDTHELYRVGTNFDKIISNAKAFIDAGGNARWDFITFKHNEHQLTEVKELSRNLGFQSFVEKQTTRFISSNTFPVLNEEAKTMYFLKPPTNTKVKLIDKKTLQDYKNVLQSCTIECKAQKEKSFYIDSLGYLWPCSWLASVPYLYTEPNDMLHESTLESAKSLQSVLDKFGGLEFFNLHNKSILEIIESEQWQKIWNYSFDEKNIIMCAKICGKFPKQQISQTKDERVNLESF